MAEKTASRGGAEKRSWWTNAKHEGAQTVSRPVDLATMPIYVRAGAIIPVDPVRQHTDEPVHEPTTIRVYRGANGTFTLYDDDGISQDYLRGRGTWTRLTWDDGARRLTIEPGPPPGSTNVMTAREFRVEFVPDGATRAVQYAGRRVTVTF